MGHRWELETERPGVRVSERRATLIYVNAVRAMLSPCATRRELNDLLCRNENYRVPMARGPIAGHVPVTFWSPMIS
jgi:hypothetical protein